MDFKYHLETAWSLTLKHIASLIFLTLTAVSYRTMSCRIASHHIYKRMYTHIFTYVIIYNYICIYICVYIYICI